MQRFAPLKPEGHHLIDLVRASVNGMSGVLGGVSSDLCSLAVLDVVTLLYQDRFNRPLHGESTGVAQHVQPRRGHRHVGDLETEPFNQDSFNRLLEPGAAQPRHAQALLLLAQPARAHPPPRSSVAACVGPAQRLLAHAPFPL